MKISMKRTVSIRYQGSTDRHPNRSEIFKILLILVRSEICKFVSALVRAGTRNRTEPLGPGPTGFGPWISAPDGR